MNRKEKKSHRQFTKVIQHDRSVTVHKQLNNKKLIAVLIFCFFALIFHKFPF